MRNTIVYFLMAITAVAADWTKPVEVLHDDQKAVSYRAKWSPPYLVVEATLEPGWHTFAMDNNRRAAEKLAGRPSLGNDLPTDIKVADGLAVDGAWYQLPPKDFSKPDLQWYSFGFEKRALFVAKVRRSAGAGPAKVELRGQACTEKICKGVDIEIAVPLTAGTPNAGVSVDLNSLVQVR